MTPCQGHISGDFRGQFICTINGDKTLNPPVHPKGTKSFSHTQIKHLTHCHC